MGLFKTLHTLHNEGTDVGLQVLYMTKSIKCTECHGIGTIVPESKTKKPRKPKKCKRCKGHGRIIP